MLEKLAHFKLVCTRVFPLAFNKPECEAQDQECPHAVKEKAQTGTAEAIAALRPCDPSSSLSLSLTISTPSSNIFHKVAEQFALAKLINSLANHPKFANFQSNFSA
jgi:hypothetical protein